MRKKASEKARLTISLAPAVFSQLIEEARVLHTPAAALAASYVEGHFERKQLAADSAAEVEKVKKQLDGYTRRHQMEINSLTTKLTRVKAALDFETAEVARLKATSTKRRQERQDRSDLNS